MSGLAFGLGGSGFVRAHQSSTKPDYLKLSATTLGTHPGGLKWLCQMDDISISPSARFLVFSGSSVRSTSLVPSGNRILLADTDCLAKEGFADSCLMTFGGLEGVRLATWTADDSGLFIVENLENLIRFKTVPGAQPLAVFEERASLGHDLGETIAVLGPAASGTARAEVARWIQEFGRQDSRPAGADVLPLKRIVSPPISGTLYYDGRSLTATMVSRGENAIPVSRAFLLQGNLAEDRNGTAMLSDIGWRIGWRGQAWTLMNVPAFSQAMISSRTGRMIGSYTLDRVSFFDRSRKSIAAEGVAQESLRQRPDAVLWRVASDENGNVAAVLKSASGASTFLLSIHGHHIKKACPSSEIPPPQVRIRVSVLGSPSWPVGIVEERPLDPKGVVAFFQGGPATNVADVVNQPLARHYLALGWAVLSVGYSGSVGFGIGPSLRLRSEGPIAFRRDAAAITTYLNRAYPGVPVIVHGESFGGGPAIALDAALSDRKGGLIAIVPYLRSRPPSAWLDTKGLFPANLTYQADWENAVMGVGDEPSRLKFNEALLSLAKGRNPTRIARFFFASLDKSSTPADLPKEYTSGSAVVSLKTVHKFITAEPDVYRGIDDMLSVQGSGR